MMESMQDSHFIEMTIGVSKTRRFHGRILAGFFAVIGLFSFLFGDTYVPDNEVIATVCAIGAGVVYFVSYGSWGKGVVMTINREGVWYRDWKLPVIPWRHVGRSYSTGIRLRPLLRIDLVDAETLFSELTDKSVEKSRNSELVKSDYLLVPNGMLEIPISQVSKAINSATQHRFDR